MKLILGLLVAASLTSCATSNLPPIIEALGHDPATVDLDATGPGFSFRFHRSWPGATNAVPH